MRGERDCKHRGGSLPRKAIVLLSGGVDSATALAIAKSDGYDCYAISYDYGQRHITELQSAGRVAEFLGVLRHLTIKFDMRSIGGSALTSDMEVPKDSGPSDVNNGSCVIPVTYVPARNTIFLSFALAWAEVLGAYDIFIGANAVDYSGYPDCRPEYLKSFQAMANLATKAAVEGRGNVVIHAPLLSMTKAEIIKTGLELGVDYSLTSSCYDPTPAGACGRCDSCVIRQRGFERLGISDPIKYASVIDNIT
ncbi:MAG: 7-cyano-7-deazaguanine synthase QueC [Nitrospirae bacterium]|nr:7-cyano-7-deazaguanine synthase QueC [Nitrospirota bacterium]